jgi:hypothetical protein
MNLKRKLQITKKTNSKISKKLKKATSRPQKPPVQSSTEEWQAQRSKLTLANIKTKKWLIN